MKLSGNKALPVLGAGTVLMVVLFVLYINSNKHTARVGGSNIDTEFGNAIAVSPDGDLPEHTLSKLSTDMIEFKDLLEGNNELVTESMDEFNLIKREISQLRSSNKQLKKELDKAKKRSRHNSDFDTDLDLDEITKKVMAEINRSESSTQKRGKEYPVAGANMDLTSTKRIRGLGVVLDKKGGVKSMLPDFMKEPDLDAVSLTNLRGHRDEDKGTPVYTLPDLSILNAATAVTHMIGRVPIKGDVTDPAPFKVVLSHDNLAANGHNIPGIEGMFMEGHVWGDATLSCVRAYVERASFVFKDGRIVNYPEKKGKKNKKGGSTESIGYLTDDYGSTCIPGKYITNAPRTLSARFLADLATGAADAYSNKETTSVVSSTGGVTTTITGNDGKYVMGQAIASGAHGVSDYIRNRNLDIWDSVLVRAGMKVAVHLQEEIPINYSENTRKISYLSTATGSMTD
ncbi:MAG: TIGR03752 family integrating conjugative element protein [Candidatus Thiodiazotropha endolucinida]|nr:TIGR03752 family integrating conjugative element protein [Candidatus Thiodiazotropha taylori]MCW4316665.1 TIGR03752 family integrating conjugative element protein [Candidatus Thiodiazotropha taylori]